MECNILKTTPLEHAFGCLTHQGEQNIAEDPFRNDLYVNSPEEANESPCSLFKAKKHSLNAVNDGKLHFSSIGSFCRKQML